MIFWTLLDFVFSEIPLGDVRQHLARPLMIQIIGIIYLCTRMRKSILQSPHSRYVSLSFACELILCSEMLALRGHFLRVTVISTIISLLIFAHTLRIARCWEAVHSLRGRRLLDPRVG